MKTALIIGSTGLIGAQLLQLLLESQEYEKVITFVKRDAGIQHPKLIQYIIDFDKPETYQDFVKGDDFFCTIGTTIKKAGSKAKQHEIDHDYVVNFARFSKEHGVKRIGVVSSIGAAATSSNFYLKTKGEMETSVTALGFEHAVFIRPSFLMGNRKEFRFGEKIAIGIFKVIKPLLVGKFLKYRGVEVTNVAKKLIHTTVSATIPVTYVESNEIA